VAEFSALFGRDRSWGYWLLREGEIRAITGYGKKQIPHLEYDRLLSELERYRGRRPTPRAALTSC
jgi:hypothetical protein